MHHCLPSPSRDEAAPKNEMVINFLRGAPQFYRQRGVNIKTQLLETLVPATWIIALQREPVHLITDQDARSWQRGYDDGMAGRPARCPVSFDKPSYRSGWIEGKAAKESGCTRGNW
jgi:ribosome modulation factor